MKQRIYDGFNPNDNRGRGKQSYLEQSFEKWLHSYNITDFIMEYKFKRFDKIKTYYVDFYFPKLKLVIELDGTQHNSITAKQYDHERDNYIKLQYGVNIIRISHKEYTNQTKLLEIKSVLSITN